MAVIITNMAGAQKRKENSNNADGQTNSQGLNALCLESISSTFILESCLPHQCCKLSADRSKSSPPGKAERETRHRSAAVKRERRDWKYYHRRKPESCTTVDNCGFLHTIGAASELDFNNTII